MHLSPSSCLRRVKALDDAGVIAGYVALLNPKAVGRHGTSYTIINLESTQPAQLEAFEQAVRDTPEILKAYVAAFSPDFVALRGSLDETKATAKAFKVFYAKVPGQDGSYTMDHTAGSYIFDASGKVRLFTRYGTGAESLKADLQQLLKG